MPLPPTDTGIFPLPQARAARSASSTILPEELDMALGTLEEVLLGPACTDDGCEGLSLAGRHRCIHLSAARIVARPARRPYGAWSTLPLRPALPSPPPFPVDRVLC